MIISKDHHITCFLYLEIIEIFQNTKFAHKNKDVVIIPREVATLDDNTKMGPRVLIKLEKLLFGQFNNFVCKSINTTFFDLNYYNI